MDVRFAQPDLRGVDGLRLDALSLTLFADERPLRGLAGQVDWRLCGQLSRWLVRGRVSGARGERTLLPLGRRLGPERLVLHGLGTREDFAGEDEEAFRTVVVDMLRTLGSAGCRSAAVRLPPLTRGGNRGPNDDRGRAMELVLEAATELARTVDEVVLLEAADDQRVMQPVVASARRRARVSG